MEIHRKFLLTLFVGLIGFISYVKADICTPEYVRTPEKLTINSSCKSGYYLLNKAKTAVVADTGLATACKSGSECKLRYCAKADGQTPCVETGLTGNFIYALNNNGILKCSTADTCEYVTGVNGNYYLNAMEDRFTKPLIKCATEGAAVTCSSVTSIKDGYYENAETSSATNANNRFIKCIGANCEIVATAANGYYSMLGQTNVVYKCISTGCSKIADADKTSSCNNDGVILGTIHSPSSGSIQHFCLNKSSDDKDKVKFVDVSESYYIVSYTNDGTGLIDDPTVFGEGGAQINAGAKKEYFLKVGNGAVYVENGVQGYYINGNSGDKDDNPILKITDGSTFTKIPKEDTFFKTSCDIQGSAAGTILKTGTEDDPTYISFCPTHGASNAINFSVTTDAYMYLKLQTGPSALGREDESVLIKYGNGKISVYDKAGKTGYILNSGPDKTEYPLIKCDSGTCTQLPDNEVANGYYKNVADDESTHPIIKCLGGSSGCVNVAISSLSTSCADAQKPDIIQVFGETKLCLSEDDSTSLEFPSSSTDTNEYYLIRQTKNMKTVFNGEVANPKDNKIVVNVQQNTVTLIHTNTGYYVNDGPDKGVLPLIQCMDGECETISNKDLATADGCSDTAGVLIFLTPKYQFCYEKSVNSLDLSGKTGDKYYYIEVEKDKSSIFTGLYELGDKVNSKRGGVLVRTNKNMVELVTEDGYYVTTNPTSKLVRCDEGNCNKEDPSTGVYINAGSAGGIIEYTQGGTGSVKSATANGYYLNYKDPSKLYYCETTTRCQSIDKPQNGYYLYAGNGHDTTNKAIMCDDNGCNGITHAACDSTKGGKLNAHGTDICTGESTNSIPIVTDGTETYHLITISYGYGGPFNVDSLTAAGDTAKILLKNTKNSLVMVTPAAGYYYNANNKLIYCKSSDAKECSEITPSDYSYYLNVGNNASIKPIIRCQGTSSCAEIADTEEDVVTTACTLGKLFFDGSTIKNFCYGDSTNKYQMDFTTDGLKYTILTLVGTTALKVKPAGTNTAEEQYIIESGDNKVTVIKSVTQNTYFINSGSDPSGNKLIKCTAANTCESVPAEEGYYIYGINRDKSIIYCSSDCEIRTAVKGYYVNGAGTANTNKIISFDGENRFSIVDASTDVGGVTSTDENTCVEGKILKKSEGEFCIDSTAENAKKLETVGVEEYLYITTTTGGNNFFTGEYVNTDLHALVQITTEKSVIIVDTDTPGDYFVPTSTSESAIIYRINGKKQIRNLIGYYLEGTVWFACGSSSCSQNDVLATSCDAESAGKIINDEEAGVKKLCKTASDTEPIDISSEEIVYYTVTGDGTSLFGSSEKKLLKVGGNKVIEVGKASGYNKEGYYLDDDDNTLIYCEKDEADQCEVVTPVEGYYYTKNDSTNYISCKKTKGVISCTSESFASQESSCNKIGKIKSSDQKFCNDATGVDANGDVYLYYKLTITESVASETPFGEAGELLIKVGKYSVTVVQPSIGYYLTATTGLNNAMIYCNVNDDISKCKAVETAKQGYYIKAEDNTKQIISCNSDCKEVDMENTETCSGVSNIIYIKNENEDDEIKGTYNYCVDESSNDGMIEIKTDDFVYEILAAEDVGSSAAFEDKVNNPGHYLIRNTESSFVVESINDKGYIVNEATDSEDYPLIEVKESLGNERDYEKVSSAKVTGVYYINAALTTNVNNLIVCNEGTCASKNVKVGYYINGSDTDTNKIIKCASDSKCVGIAVDADSTSTDIDTTGTECTVAGKILVGGSNFCDTSSGNGVSISETDASFYYFASTVTGTLITGKSLVKVANNAVTVLTTIPPGYYKNSGSGNPILKCTISNTCTPVTSELTKCSDTGVKIGSLIKDSTDKFYVCIGTDDSDRLEITESDTSDTYYSLKITDTIFGSANDNVILRKGKKFINKVLTADDEVDSTSKNIYINNSAKTLSSKTDYEACCVDGSITNYEYKNNKYLDTEYRKCVINCDVTKGGCKEGYYIVDKDYKLITTAGTEGTLYQCTSGSCNEPTSIPIGYIINAGNTGETGKDVPYIVCSPTVSGIKCKVADIPSAAGCSGSTGYIFKHSTDSKIRICLGLLSTSGTDNGVVLDTSSTSTEAEGEVKSERYIVKVDDNGIFGNYRILRYVTVTVEAGNATVDKVQTGQNIPLYKYTDEKYKIYETTSKDLKDTVCKKNNEIYEFKFEKTDEVNKINYYELNDYKKNA
ncbi:scaffoldin [Anaeromyces robustus]|uniref:Scaffoldin n=1 Tax=Anaeromyces robustus TaxID=1754192 RepID=A0A1Y1WPH7_9FUNG|nr:scaffoldin [Anaeromyces robustus]|eukprot:ORX75451.1 scaffoldin [Anaeromyces robustus]